MTDDKAPSRLFSTEGTAALSDHPALLGGKCGTCGYVFFPMQSYGCERCGSESLKPLSLTGRGRLLASAEVSMSPGAWLPAPYTIGSIMLDDGAFVRAILDVPPGVPVKIDQVVVTRAVPQTRPDRGEHDLRFALAGEV